MITRAAFTLVELMVVLLILVALAGVATLSTEGLVEQARYDATAKTMEALGHAIAGPEDLRHGDGTQVVAGFCADIGRSPRGPGLDELWLQGALPGSALSPLVPVIPGDTGMKLLGGWRGPYVRPPTNSTGFTDAWGEPFVYKRSDGQVALAGDEIAIVECTAASAGGVRPPPIDVSKRLTGSLLVNVSIPVTTLPSTFIVVRVAHLNSGVTQTSEKNFSTASLQPFLFTDLPIGPLAIRAYRYDIPAPFISSTGVSRIVYRTMIPSGTDVSLTIE